MRLVNDDDGASRSTNSSTTRSLARSRRGKHAEYFSAPSFLSSCPSAPSSQPVFARFNHESRVLRFHYLANSKLEALIAEFFCWPRAQLVRISTKSPERQGLSLSARSSDRAESDFNLKFLSYHHEEGGRREQGLGMGEEKWSPSTFTRGCTIYMLSC